MGSVKINKKHKDRLFCLLFGSAERKENILSLYNTLNGTAYTDTDLITIYTMDDVIYIKMKNDVSIILDSYLSLWEQQSSYNPNMPIRGFMYFGNMYNRYIEENKLNIYGKKLIKIPTPKYIVLYNGTQDAPAVEKLKLSDAFINSNNSGEFEWTATVYNINPNMNDGLLNKCKALKDYMIFINRIRSNLKKHHIEEAVEEAVKSCIEDGIMADVLMKLKSEVKDMCLTEYNEKVFIDGIRNEGIEEGKAEGRAEGKTESVTEIITRMLSKGVSVEEIADLTGADLAFVKDIAAKVAAKNKN